MYANGAPTSLPSSVGSIYVLKSGFYILASTAGQDCFDRRDYNCVCECVCKCACCCVCNILQCIVRGTSLNVAYCACNT